MAKIVLGARPKLFKAFPVSFTMPDGTEGTITATYRYRTRKEFGEMLNEAYAEAAKAEADAHKAVREGDAAPVKRGKKAAAPKEEVVTPVPAAMTPMDFQALYAGISDKNADHLFRAIVAWDLDVPLSLESLRELADELPAGAAALMAAYSVACTQGRLGN
jgi:hypothetical protein